MSWLRKKVVESVDDDIIVEDERVDEEGLVHKNDYIIDLEEVDF